MKSNPVSMTDAEVATFLSEVGYSLQLATNGSDGYPHLAAMWYVFTRGHVYFNTYGSSQKGKNLTRDPRVACMIESGKQYKELRGVVIQGNAVPVSDQQEFDEVSLALIRRYPMPSREATAEQVLKGIKQTKRVLYRVEAKKVYSWNHAKSASLQPRKS